MRPIATSRSTAGVPTGTLAVWWLLASEIVIFGGVLCSYIMHRLSHDWWAHEAAHTAPGVGLGLALCRRLSRSMGGDLSLDRLVKDGACFVLWLPATSAAPLRPRASSRRHRRDSRDRGRGRCRA